jgi:hypothetical protein
MPLEMAFPEVELVHHIPCPGHPLGRYVRERKRVELSRKELAGRNEVERRFALYHELGHWWRTERVPDRLMRGGEDEEEFADMFAFFFVGGSELDANAREVFVDGITMLEEAKILGFAEEVLGRLDAELGRGD